jgi:hypothetical protein
VEDADTVARQGEGVEASDMQNPPIVAGFCLTSFENLATYPIDKPKRMGYTVNTGQDKTTHKHGETK